MKIADVVKLNETIREYHDIRIKYRSVLLDKISIGIDGTNNGALIKVVKPVLLKYYKLLYDEVLDTLETTYGITDIEELPTE